MTVQALTPARITMERRRRGYARRLCRYHAAPLLCMASILLDDIDAASDIVAATVAAACRPIQYLHASSRHTRMELARSVYWRCVGRLAAVERFGPATPRSASDPGQGTESDLNALSSVQRAVLALTVFGLHDLRQLADTLQISERAVTLQVRELMVMRDRADSTARPASDADLRKSASAGR